MEISMCHPSYYPEHHVQTEYPRTATSSKLYSLAHYLKKNKVCQIQNGDFTQESQYQELSLNMRNAGDEDSYL